MVELYYNRKLKILSILWVRKWKLGFILSPIPPATAAAKSLQSCPTLCDTIDGSPPGSPVPGILQARTLEWVVISFSNAWKWKWSHSVVSDSEWPHGLQPTRLLRPWDFPGKSTGVGCHCLLHSSFHPPKFRQRICHLIWIYDSIDNFTLKSWFVHSFIGVSLNKCWLRGCCKPWRMWREQGFQVPDLLYISDTKARATQRMTDRMGTCISPMAWRQYLIHRERSFPLQTRIRGHSGNSILDTQASWPWTGKTTTGV